MPPEWDPLPDGASPVTAGAGDRQNKAVIRGSFFFRGAVQLPNRLAGSHMHPKSRTNTISGAYVQHGLRAPGIFFIRLKQQPDSAVQRILMSAQQLCRSSSMVVCMSWPQVCAAEPVAAKGRPLHSCMGSASMSAAAVQPTPNCRFARSVPRRTP